MIEIYIFLVFFFTLHRHLTRSYVTWAFGGFTEHSSFLRVLRWSSSTLSITQRFLENIGVEMIFQFRFNMCFRKHIVLFPSITAVANIFCVALTCSFGLRHQIIYERRKLPSKCFNSKLVSLLFSIFNFLFVSNQWLWQWILFQMVFFL